jgi:hypothetical protein
VGAHGRGRTRESRIFLLCLRIHDLVLPRTIIIVTVFASGIVVAVVAPRKRTLAKKFAWTLLHLHLPSLLNEVRLNS